MWCHEEVHTFEGTAEWLLVLWASKTSFLLPWLHGIRHCTVIGQHNFYICSLTDKSKANKPKKPGSLKTLESKPGKIFKSCIGILLYLFEKWLNLGFMLNNSCPLSQQIMSHKMRQIRQKKYLQTNVQRYGKANDLPFIALFEGIILVICRLVKKKKYTS